MSAPQADNMPDRPGSKTPAERAARGWAVMAEVMHCRIPESAVGEPASLAGLSAQHIFGDLWERPALSRRERRLITLAVLAVLGQDRLHAPLHIKAALDSGDLSEDELRETAVQIAYYAGWPLATSFDAAVDRATGRDTGYDQAGRAATGPARSATTRPEETKEQP